jgi:hypothetical protein
VYRYWHSYAHQHSVLLEDGAEPLPVTLPWEYESTVSYIDRTGTSALATVCCGPAAPYPGLSTAWTEPAPSTPPTGALSICGAPGERGRCELDWRHTGERKHAITLPSGLLTFRW